MDASPFPATLTTVDQLRDHYREPNRLVLDKVVEELDETAADFIGRSTFCLIGTADAAGRCDVSPKGGDAGFVQVDEAGHLLIPDLNGNNRLDTLRNIIVNPQVGMLFLVPGRGETVRVNGRAWVSVADELRDRFTDRYRRPASVIGVEPTEVYLHCAKCIRRGGLWDPDSWGDPVVGPSAGAILAAHARLDDIAAVDAGLEQRYARGLADDRPG